jgi:hypothetical protein
LEQNISKQREKVVLKRQISAGFLIGQLQPIPVTKEERQNKNFWKKSFNVTRFI